MKAVLKEVQNSRIDRVLCLGDVVGYGADPARCVQMLRDVKAGMVIGNHEWEVLRIRKLGMEHLGPNWQQCGYATGLVHSARSLNQEQVDWLASVPSWGEVDQCLAAHANLEDPMRFGYIESLEEALPTIDILQSRNVPVGFFGHTHVQEVFCREAEALDWIDETKFRVSHDHPSAVMVGSVGKSRMVGNLRAAWVIYDGEKEIVELKKTEYDRIAAAKAMAAAGLPEASAACLLTEEEWVHFKRCS